jgi:hypothetical protein
LSHKTSFLDARSECVVLGVIATVLLRIQMTFVDGRVVSDVS